LSTLGARIRAFSAAWNGLNWSREELDRHRDACLRDLVQHAYENVPYYRAAFTRAGLHPRDIQGLADLSRIPITAREDIQTAPDEFIAKNFRRQHLAGHRSSGSRGVPVWTRRTRFEERLLSAVRLRVRLRYGFRLTDKRAAITMEESDDVATRHPLTARFGLLRRTEIDASLPPREIIAAMRTWRPDIITGYPATIARVVELMTPEDRRAIRPRLVGLGGEMVLPSFRREIASCFQCRVYETYGATETNLIAWECPSAGNLHVCEHSLVLEICRDGKSVEPGEPGEAVITMLHPRAMPFLRYALGDVVTASGASCDCGHPSSTIAAIQGRTNDWFTLPDGRLLHPFVVSEAVMKHVPGVRRLQVIQSSQHELTVLIVLAQPLSADDLAEAQRKFAAAVDSGFDITLKPVRDIESPAHRKFNPFVPLQDRYNLPSEERGEIS
jgi:phenylacetate-CoA ligase